MGEGGAVITQKKSDFKVLESFRDWEETVGVLQVKMMYTEEV